AARHVFAVHAGAIAHGAHFARTQRAHGVEVVAPCPAILVINWDPEMPVHGMIATGRDHGEARQHPRGDAPIVIAVLGIAPRAEEEATGLLHDFEIGL